MFKIKICGITNPEDALAAIEAGADALGFNFYAKSLRHVDREKLAEWVETLPHGIVKVGLFVNHSLRVVIDSFEKLRLDLIQLHGEETPNFIQALEFRPVMKVFRLEQGGLPVVEGYLDKCRSLKSLPSRILFDAFVKDQYGKNLYGGTGKTADWETCSLWHKCNSELPLVLAGGLTPENVAEAIRVVRPDSVDTASGVESAPGKKDPQKMRAFIENARKAFEELDAAK